MRLLFLGYGNITKALLGILEGLGERDQWDITVAEIRNGVSGEEMIRRRHDEFDAVVNLTDAEVLPILELCNAYGLAYIDAAFECEADGEAYLAAYREMLAAPRTAPRLFGFGMNPGIVELIPVMYAPKRPYIACEVDTDLPEQDGTEMFTTWSSRIYADELVYARSYALGRGGTFLPIREEDRHNIPLTVENRREEYCIVPHEELHGLSICDENCMGSIFLYHGPGDFQKYLIANRNQKPETLKYPPVKHQLRGSESVGILFYDGTDNLRYVRNRSDHALAYRFCGSNATCFQAASGIYVAMNLLPIVPKDCSYCFTDAAKRYAAEIGAVLRKLKFDIEVVENAVNRSEFEQKILPIFGGSSALNV